MTMRLSTSDVITRYPGNPVLARHDVPYPSGLVFNAGVTKFQGRYVCVFRNDVADFEARQLLGVTNNGLAFSEDGLHWRVTDRPCFAVGNDEQRRAYDVRLTVIDGRVYLCFAVDTRHGIRGGIAVTDDFEDFEVLSLSAPDNRNMVLFPERIGGEYVRLERPFPVYGRGAAEAFDIWLSRSPDGVYWGKTELILGSEQVSFCNRKIGPAAPPIRTDKGWLTLFHTVDYEDGRNWGWEGDWNKRYTAGVMLLDLEDPTRIVGRYDRPLMVPAPDVEYEAAGFRDYVIFPCGAILENDGEVKIYYGAADTVVALATASVDELLGLCGQ